MQRSPKSYLKASALVFATVLVGAIGYGMSGQGQALPIWTKNAQNEIVPSPRSGLIVDLGSSTLKVATGTIAGAFTQSGGLASLASTTITGNSTTTGNAVVQGSLTASSTWLGNTVLGSGVKTINTSTTLSTSTATASDLCTNGLWTVTATNNTTGTINLPTATSTNVSTCLAYTGASKSVRIRTTTSSEFTLTIATSSGWYTAAGVALVIPHASPSSTPTITGDQWGLLTITRISDTSSTAEFIRFY